MTVDVLIYACGGGLGHAVRGQVLSRIANSCGYTVRVLVRPGIIAAFRNLGHSHENLEELNGDYQVFETHRHAHLLVDTFPLGLHNELAPVLRNFKKRSFIARYSEAITWSRVEELYERIFLPYSRELSEWDSIPRKASFIGFLLRPERFTWRPESKRLSVLDPEQRLSTSFLEELRLRATRQGYRINVHSSFGRVLNAEKVLCIGAGYNTVYESLRDAIDMRFVPVRKRFDNQFKRVLRYKRSVGDWGALDAWLRDTPPLSLSHLLQDSERAREVFLNA